MRKVVLSTLVAAALSMAFGGIAEAQVIVGVTSEPAGINCADGGTKVTTAVDALHFDFFLGDCFPGTDGVPDNAQIGLGAACPVAPVPDVDSYVCSTAGTNSLIEITTEPAGANCSNGGQLVEVGLDNADGGETANDGILGVGEVDDFGFTCHGVPGVNSVTRMVDEPAGTNCTVGGKLVQFGLDDGLPSGTAGNGLLDTGEADFTGYICNGVDSLISLTTEPAGTNCTSGGQVLRTGPDDGSGGGTVGNGVLETGEATFTEYICNGDTSLVTVTTEPAGGNCAMGGQRFDSGVDDGASPNDGILDADEIDATAYVCNGFDSLVTLLPEAPGGNCASGGHQIETGVDDGAGGGTAGDGSLDAGEVDATAYVCHGLNAAVRAFPLSAGSAPCFNGGVTYWLGQDDNHNGTVDAPEIDATNNICNGLNSLTAIYPDGGPPFGTACATGGQWIAVGVDDNGNGFLDLFGEVDSAAVVCNGANSLTEVSALSPYNTFGAGLPSALDHTCATGGYLHEVGTDWSGDFILDPGEIDFSVEICTGLNTIISAAPASVSDCPNGGTEFAYGVDGNNDGFLTPPGILPPFMDLDTIYGYEFVCNGLDSLMAVSLDPPSATCPNGGRLVEYGVDDDNDGSLDVSEVDNSFLLCDALNSLTEVISPNPSCPNGGFLFASGLDTDGSNGLTVDEYDFTEDVCNGLDSLIEATQLLVGDADCPTGGQRLDVGTDTDGSGDLQPVEIAATSFVCGGANSIVELTTLAPGDDPSCPAGGELFEVGSDADGSGDLSGGEVASSAALCHGVDSLSVLTPVLPGVDISCPAGGNLFEIGPDTNGNGILDPGEITGSTFVCSGINGLIETTNIVANPGNANCPGGGTQIDVGTDVNGDGVLNPGQYTLLGTLEIITEITATRYACNGVYSLTTLSVEAPGGNCSGGGHRIDVGPDADQNGVLDSVTDTAFVCHGISALIAVTDISPNPGNANCPAGGTQLDVGPDTDGSGTLDPGEVTATQYACNGIHSLTVLTPEGPGGNCSAGGHRIDVGPDADSNGLLDSTTTTAYVCHGVNALIEVTDIVADVDNDDCPAGGTQLDIGPDTNGSGDLDPGEITATRYACNGVHSLTAMTVEPPGGNCSAGGHRIDIGPDADDDGSLDSIDATAYVCHGLDSLIVVNTEGPGGNCSAGGHRFDIGPDTNGDNVLDLFSEADTTVYVCDGIDSLMNILPESPGGNCSAGGYRFEVGPDTDGSGTLDGDEIEAYSYVCDAINSLIDVSTEPAGENCSHGGYQVDVGGDTDGDSVLDGDEVDATAYICNGINSIVDVTAEDPGENCPSGGQKIEVGGDDDGDGILDNGEVDAVTYVCNGETGPNTLTNVITEGAGANCPIGGYRLEFGVDDNENGELEAEEVDTVSYLCNGTNGVDGEDVSGGGCSVSPASGSLGGSTDTWLLFGLLGALWWRRRRR